MRVLKKCILSYLVCPFLLYLHLYGGSRFPTLALRGRRMRHHIAIIFIHPKVVVIASHLTDLVLLGIVALILVNKAPFVLLANVICWVLVR